MEANRLRDWLVELIVLPALCDRYRGPHFEDGTEDYVAEFIGEITTTIKRGRQQVRYVDLEGLPAVDLAARALRLVERRDGLDDKVKWKVQTKRLVEVAHQLLTANKALIEALVERNRAADFYKGWARFFLVQNNGGHIHKDMNCQTCNKRGKETQFGWLPELAALTEAEAVAAYGAILCTVCYPTAPVEWTDGRKADDDLYCPADQGLDETKQIRRGYYTGNGGTCKACGQRVTVTREGYGKIRKHKKEGAK